MFGLQLMCGGGGPACLELEAKVAVLAPPNECGSEEHCIGVCSEDAINMAWVPMEGNPQIGRWRRSKDHKDRLGHHVLDSWKIGSMAA
jgi:hypothetical protein